MFSSEAVVWWRLCWLDGVLGLVILVGDWFDCGFSGLVLVCFWLCVAFGGVLLVGLLLDWFLVLLQTSFFGASCVL